MDHLAVSINWGSFFAGVLIRRALLFGVYVWALGKSSLAYGAYMNQGFFCYGLVTVILSS